MNITMQNSLRTNGINNQPTVEYTPEQNGVAKMANKTICEGQEACHGSRPK
jgi:hypothetical protein